VYTYFVFVTAPNAPGSWSLKGIFRNFREARAFAKKADGYRTIRKLPRWRWNFGFGPLPEYNDTEAIG
jgi:hypothetical protein